MDPLTLTTAATGSAALAFFALATRWRTRAHRAETEAAALRGQLQIERHAATHDVLTGLPNRRAFYHLGEEHLASATRQPLLVALIDLNGFKQVNDRFGHAAGDEVLITIARRFADYAGDNLVARLGGDEFVGLLTSPVLDEHSLALRSRRLSEVLSQPMRVSGRTVVVTAAVGIAPLAATSDLADAVRRADAAMYRTKTAGRGTDEEPRVRRLSLVVPF